jgi:N-acyl-D-amino-acid deacylase
MIFRVLRIFTLVALLNHTLFAENVILVGGSVIDGSGKPRVRTSVRIRDGEVTDIGAVRAARGETTINVAGLIVAPGFIDIHNHSTTVLENNLDATSQVTQGITTIAVGLDGEGPFEVENFMARFDESQPALNVVAYTGHSTIRRQVLGTNAERSATADEIKAMEELVEMGMREGAFGLSTSFSTGVSRFASKEEVIALARVVARYGGSLACELRSYGDDIVNAVKEVVDIARQVKLPIEISHLKLSSQAMAGKAAQVLTEMDRARMQGLDIAADINGYAETPGVAPSEKDVRDLIRNAWVLVASDGRIGDTHPRAAGAFSRILSQFVAAEKALTLEVAIRKMSALPAARLGLKQRGVLQRGAVADVVVFDPAKIKDSATMENPAALAQGVKYVFVNGVMVIKDGMPTGALPGNALR